MPGEAVVALAAMGKRHHDVVSRSQAGDVLADLFNDAGPFMPQHNGVGRYAQIAPHGVGMANASGYDSDQNFVCLRARESNFFNGKILPLCVGDCRLDFHV